jgi:hypothetical protein
MQSLECSAIKAISTVHSQMRQRSLGRGGGGSDEQGEGHRGGGYRGGGYRGGSMDVEPSDEGAVVSEEGAVVSDEGAVVSDEGAVVSDEGAVVSSAVASAASAATAVLRSVVLRSVVIRCTPTRAGTGTGAESAVSGVESAVSGTESAPTDAKAPCRAPSAQACGPRTAVSSSGFVSVEGRGRDRSRSEPGTDRSPACAPS